MLGLKRKMGPRRAQSKRLRVEPICKLPKDKQFYKNLAPLLTVCDRVKFASTSKKIKAFGVGLMYSEFMFNISRYLSTNSWSLLQSENVVDNLYREDALDVLDIHGFNCMEFLASCTPASDRDESFCASLFSKALAHRGQIGNECLLLSVCSNNRFHTARKYCKNLEFIAKCKHTGMNMSIMHAAVQHGYQSCVFDLLADDKIIIDYNAKNENGDTAIHFILNPDNPLVDSLDDLCDMINDEKIDLNCTNRMGHSFLQSLIDFLYIVKSQDAVASFNEFVSTICEAFQDVSANKIDFSLRCNWEAIVKASNIDNDLFTQLVSMYCDFDGVDVDISYEVEVYGRLVQDLTLLKRAYQLRDIDAAELLVFTAGADPRTADGFSGAKFLIWFVHCGRISMAEYIFSSFDFNFSLTILKWTVHSLICTPGDRISSILNSILSSVRDAEILEKILMPNPKETLFMAYARSMNINTARAILSHHTKFFDLDTQNNTGNTALHRAAACKRLDLMELFIDAGADVNIKNLTGRTPLLVFLGRHVDDIKMSPALNKLINCTHNVNAHDCTGTTALMLASCTGSIAVIEEILKRGADVNKRDNMGNSAVIHAMMNKQFCAAAELIVKGADMHQCNHSGLSGDIFVDKCFV